MSELTQYSRDEYILGLDNARRLKNKKQKKTIKIKETKFCDRNEDNKVKQLNKRSEW